jgi:competence protein ComEC
MFATRPGLALTGAFANHAGMSAQEGSAALSAGLPPRPGGRLRDFVLRRLHSLESRAEAEREQLPLWLPVGFGIGIAAWFGLPEPRAWIAFLLAALALAALALAFASGTRAGRAFAFLAIAASIGCADAWWRAERVAMDRLTRERTAEFVADVESVQRLAGEKEKVRLVVRPVDAPDLPPRFRINAEAKGVAATLQPGARVRLRGWLMPPAAPAVPGAYDFARSAWFQRIGATGTASAVESLPGGAISGWRATLASWRQRIGAHIQHRLGSGGEGGIATSLVTGDQGGLSEGDADAMRRSGLAHLLSVSGLHLTAVVGAVMLLTLKLLALSPALALRFRLTLFAAAAAALVGIAYTLLTGAEVPTVRSCIAALLVLAGIAIGREAMTLRLLAVAALAVLILWPESLIGPSFQLSFAAITAIIAFHDHPRVRDFLARREEGLAARIGRGLAGLVLTGLVVELALLPIGLYHFHKSGLYGALANIVAIPLTTFVIMPLEALALLLDLVGLGAPFWWATGLALRFLLWLAHSVAAAPGAVAMLPTMPDGAYALMLLGGLWLALWRTRWRWWGAAPFALGAAWALATPAPDLLITGDGRHLALRGPDGAVAILRGRAGDYVRDMLAESSGIDAELRDIDGLPGARCNDHACVATIGKDGRQWRILATRTRWPLLIEPLVRACAIADIVISDRRLPRGCAPRWLKADAPMLARSGGLSIRLGDPPVVTSVAAGVGKHPWSFYRRRQSKGAYRQ